MWICLVVLLGSAFCADRDLTKIKLNCSDLPSEQLSNGKCEPETTIRKGLQAYRSCIDHAPPCCSANRTITALCRPKEGVYCIPQGEASSKLMNGMNGTFDREVPCRYVTGYDYRTALILSVFLGMFGIDRFYLGYYAIGLLKFCTCGFFLLGHLIDIILIATQTVGPADGSDYLIAYFGPILSRAQMQNYTYYQYGSYYYKTHTTDEL